MGRPQFTTRRQPALVSDAGFTWELERDLFALAFPTGDVIAAHEKVRGNSNFGCGATLGYFYPGLWSRLF